MIVRIVAPHFVAGFDVDEKTPRKTPPILHYMRNWTLKEIEEYAKRKGWSVERLPA